MTSWDPAGLEKFRAVGTQREVRMTLAPGQRWPDTMRRGQAVDFDFIFGDERRRFAGRVRFRRLNVAVLDGTLA